MNYRTIKEIRSARPAVDGDRVSIRRITGMQHEAMDPILLVDELRSESPGDLGGGFPAHPHRGMQTLTYMKRGGIVHEDNLGNRGEIRGGGAQWMSAGSGIIHSEMPTDDGAGFHGFQLWVNLPRKDKMCPPRYKDVPAEALVQLSANSYQATAIAGTWVLQAADEPAQSVVGPLEELSVQASVLDLEVQGEQQLDLVLPATHNLLAYVYQGELTGLEQQVGPGQMLITHPGAERWQVKAGAKGAGVLILRGEPLAEPVAHYGPFVMNTAAEIDQALSEFQTGSFGTAAPAPTS